MQNKKQIQSNIDRFILIECCNFENFPVGGQLLFAKQIMKVYKEKVALVGLTSSLNDKIGVWQEKEFDGKNYLFLPVKFVKVSYKKPIIPLRLQCLFALLKHRRKILELGINKVFTQCPEALFVISSLNFANICYNAAGLNNPLKASRYKWARLFTRIFEVFFYRNLRKAKLILASADEEEIEKFKSKKPWYLYHVPIYHFPTRVNTDIFKPRDMKECRKILNLDPNKLIIVTVGRISKVKGWDFLLETLSLIKEKKPNVLLVFVGDGEDKNKLIDYSSNKGLQNNIIITGAIDASTVSLWINAAELVWVGSTLEGWSLAMLEAIACGKPIVSTNVSGAKDLIVPWKNGFIVEERNPQYFAEYTFKALELDPKIVKETCLEITEKYSIKTLKNDLDSLWLIKN
ncbi:MAG: glycosyltransferase family 4 protein [candidate division WOR-3 bacterium]